MFSLSTDLQIQTLDESDLHLPSMNISGKQWSKYQATVA